MRVKFEKVRESTSILDVYCTKAQIVVDIIEKDNSNIQALTIVNEYCNTINMDEFLRS